MTTTEIINGVEHVIDWYNTGKVLDRVDCYDWTEFAEWFGIN